MSHAEIFHILFAIIPPEYDNLILEAPNMRLYLAICSRNLSKFGLHRLYFANMSRPDKSNIMPSSNRPDA